MAETSPNSEQLQVPPGTYRPCYHSHDFTRSVQGRRSTLHTTEEGNDIVSFFFFVLSCFFTIQYEDSNDSVVKWITEN